MTSSSEISINYNSVTADISDLTASQTLVLLAACHLTDYQTDVFLTHDDLNLGLSLLVVKFGSEQEVIRQLSLERQQKAVDFRKKYN